MLKQLRNKANLIQLCMMYPKAQCLDRFCLTIFFNNIFFFIPKASVHNLADDNTLCSFAKTLRELVTVLQTECETAINWLYNNKIIVNPDTFQVIRLYKGRSGNTNIEVEIGNEKISSYCR